MRLKFFIFLILLSSVKAFAAGPTKTQPFVKVGPHVIFVEVAKTPEQWERGLMFRDELALNQGMLFYGRESKPQSFWMKNTPLSLDILFIDKNMRIIHIAENTTPFSLKAIPSLKPALHVLEIRGGRSKSLNIKEGHLVELHLR